MNIYSINQCICDCVDQETGEVLDVERLEALMIERDKKIEDVALWYKNVVAETHAIKAEIKALSERSKRNEKLSENLKSYLSNALDGSRFKTSKVSVSFRKSSAVEVAECADIPIEYLHIKYEPDKSALKTALENGASIAGVSIVNKRNVLIK